MEHPEIALRETIMAGLREHLSASGGTVSRDELEDFTIAPGLARRLIDRNKGIWNPRELAATLSIVSSPDGPYADREEGGLLRYSYRAGSVAGDNHKLRMAMALELPVILLRKIVPGLYMPIFPVYVVADDVDNREFVVALDESLRFLGDPVAPAPAEKRYAQGLPGVGSISRSFESRYFGPTKVAAPSVASVTANSWTLRTSSAIRRTRATPWCRMD